MPTLLYRQLASWYRLVDPVADHEPEAAAWQAAFERCVHPAASTLLELGCGAGHNAFHLKRRFSCSLTDLSTAMLDLSRALNPECEHLEGDMRTLRLGRTFDAVLLHDAVMYLTSEADLRAAVMTAFLHTRPGGAAIVAPDYVRETFREGSQLIDGEDGPRALRCVEWHWDPDESDETYVVDYAFLLRDRAGTRVVHDRHTLGLFPRATWVRILEGAGYVIDPMGFTLRGPGCGEVFVCRRPESFSLRSNPQ